MWETETARRIRIFTVLIGAIILSLLLRLAWMQLLHGPQYKRLAEENRLRGVSSQGPRGIFYDRRGAVLVSNRPSFAISIIPREYTSPREATPALAALLNMPQADIEAMLAAGRGYPYTPIRVKRDADQSILAKIEERKAQLPGVIVEATPVRHYVYGSLAAHVFGYIGRIDEEEYAVRRETGYSPNDLIGKDGLERVWEEQLKGGDGGRQVEVNAGGEEVGLAGERPVRPGNSLVLTLDANLQKAAEDALAAQIAASRRSGHPARGGAAVALDIRSGAVLAMASSPAFDPNVFVRGITAREWNALVGNADRPLHNRAIQSGYPPGSVFKIVTAAAALDRGLVSAAEVFDDKGVYVLDGWRFYGWETKGLGRLRLEDALAWSSDPVFYELGRRLGIDALAAYALTFGFGGESGIGLRGEAKGIVPTIGWKLETYGEGWYPGETLIAAIGQGYYLATPLQQARLLMAVANGGLLYRPLLVTRVVRADGAVAAEYPPVVTGTVYLQPGTWDTIRSGLVAVTTRGTAAAAFRGFGPGAAGKTGSSETGKGTVHAWFACYAPVANPEIAVAVLIEEGGEGSSAAAPVARRILEAYFGL